MSDTVRVFIAFELPQRVIASIAEIQSHLKECGLNLRWVRPENIHLTLKFLGDIRPAAVETVEDAVGGALCGIHPFSLEASGVGAFPNLRRPRVVWTGIAGETRELKHLHTAVENGLEAVGFSKEARPFKGHLTLGRVKGTATGGVLAQALAARSGFRSGPFAVDRLFLMKSDLKPTGSEYTKLIRFEMPSGRSVSLIDRKHGEPGNRGE